MDQQRPLNEGGQKADSDGRHPCQQLYTFSARKFFASGGRTNRIITPAIVSIDQARDALRTMLG